MMSKEESKFYLDTGQDEVVHFRYKPTFGVQKINGQGTIDGRFLQAKHDNVNVECELKVTSWRILILLSIPGLMQPVEICYPDLKGIYAEIGMLNVNHGVHVMDSRGMSLHLNVTRPQLVATDIWANICSQLIVHLGSIGKINQALSIINSYDVSSIRVPADYADLRGGEIMNYQLGLGFCFPVNQQPYIKTGAVVESVSAWLRSNQVTELSKDIDSPHTTNSSDRKNKMLGNNLVGLFLPKISQFGREYVIVRWLIDNDIFVKEDEPVVQILVRDVGCCSNLKAVASGRLRQIRFAGKMLEIGEMLGIIDMDYSLARVDSRSSIPVQIASSDNIPTTTSDAIRKGLVNTSAGSIPQFIPSFACEPIGFSPHETPEDDLKYAFSNVDLSFQSFYNDLKVISASGVNDDVVSCACFDESLYCALVREMHRYSLAEISDNQTDLAKKNAGLGAMVGSLLGLMSGNIFAPFLGHSYGKNLSDRSRRVEEFLPDPNLLFYQDENSYLSWSKGQVTSPRLRRLIIDRRLKPDGNVFFRLVPAIVTADSVYPVQLFKVDSSTYFYRPFSAGIQRNQPHYDSIKIQRRYFHLRGEGSQSGTEVQVLLSGKDVEDEKCPVFRFKGSSLDYFYLDFKIHPGSVF